MMRKGKDYAHPANVADTNPPNITDFRVFKMIRWEHPKQRRFYRASIQRDLFGRLEILCVSGKLDARNGSCKPIYCNNPDHLKEELRKIFRARRKSGYKLFP